MVSPTLVLLSTPVSAASPSPYCPPEGDGVEAYADGGRSLFSH
jgi:hypothetical protein